MPTDQWYRNKGWSPAVEREFFEHLARSRTQRDQYLVIQALTVAEKYPDVALRLVNLYFETKRSSFEDLRALLARAKAYESVNSLPLQIETLKQILSLERLKPSQKSTAYVDYPYLVATNRLVSEYEHAKFVLLERESDLLFPADKFKWHAALALIEHDFKQDAKARGHARAALEAASASSSGFRFHKDVGLVGSEHESAIAALRRIDA